MSQDEVVAVMKAHRNDFELVSKQQWEQVRLQCYYNIVAFGGKVKSPKELFLLPWDKEKVKTRAEVIKDFKDVVQSRIISRS
jgi:hypothetical protein